MSDTTTAVTVHRHRRVHHALRMMHGDLADLLAAERRRLEEADDMSPQERDEEGRWYAAKLARLDELHPGLAWLLDPPATTDEEELARRTDEGLAALRRLPHWSAAQLVFLTGPHRASLIRPRQLRDGTWATQVPYAGDDEAGYYEVATPRDPRLDVESALIVCGLT